MTIVRNVTLGTLLSVVAMLLVFGATHTAEAATIVVDTVVDENTINGSCSLREALLAADTNASVDSCAAGSGADTITVPPGVYTLTLGVQLTITSDIAIVGGGADTTIIEAASSSGTATARVLIINAGTVSLTGLTFRHGNIADHRAGIRNSGVLTVTDSTISDNSSISSRHGGGINNTTGSTLVVVRSTFSGNSASEGGAIQNRGSATITNSTFSGNSASNSGGGLDNISGTSVVTNSTFTSNSAGSGGGIFNIFGSVTITNTIVFGNTGSSLREDCFSGITSGGHNLVGIGTGCPTGGTGDVATANAMLGALQDNGGTTFTHAPQSGSPAVDAGDDGAAPVTDQIGTTRPVGSASDIGAFEGTVGGGAAAVPGLSQWGLIAMALALTSVFAWRTIRRRNLTQA